MGTPRLLAIFSFLDKLSKQGSATCCPIPGMYITFFSFYPVPPRRNVTQTLLFSEKKRKISLRFLGKNLASRAFKFKLLKSLISFIEEFLIVWSNALALSKRRKTFFFQLCLELHLDTREAIQ